ncbi:uncharacterized protein CLUP02_04086 [Colletotrichum lupini]|uniref:Uncharacterized protein n=1 Tax=Colletotrichum lupini TaxID=145971 RepID=A0A9Q8WCS7_9PEZI|nr:uncharacterized protein CLUP02_04086 [Colletotrichum lupini]UQC78609.1 hypothetical protein CLUP02_04086 [Colletotrichum lupini]
MVSEPLFGSAWADVDSLIPVLIDNASSSGYYDLPHVLCSELRKRVCSNVCMIFSHLSFSLRHNIFASSPNDYMVVWYPELGR